MIKDGRVCPNLMMITGWMVSRIVFVVVSSYRRRYNRDHQLPPYFEVVRSLDDQRNMRIFFFFNFRGWGAWGSAPTLIAPWWRGTHRGHVSPFDWLMGPVSGEAFSDFPHFSR